MIGAWPKKRISTDDVFQSRATFQLENYTARTYYEEKFLLALKNPK